MIDTPLTINCKGQLLDLTNPIVMGILNITPDSFYKASRFNNDKTVLAQAEQMLNAGAKILDIGGMSSRPGAAIVDLEEELQRILPVVESLHRHFPEAILSVDTIRAKVAEESVWRGVSMINDISAGRLDAELFPTLARLGVPYVLMHMKGTPEDMQQQANYRNITLDIADFLIQKIGELRQLGVKDIIVDVGFGFGKTIPQNYELLRNMHQFQILGLPILAGISRKSMIYKTLNITAQEALNGTSALHMIALQQGAKLLRVHDVKEAQQVIDLFLMLTS